MTETILAGRPDRGPAPHFSLTACRASGCDHLECRRAERAHERLSPPVPAAGTVRRLRALTWNGFSCPDLAARLGVPRRVVRRLLTGRAAIAGQVPADLAAAVSGLYDAVWALYGGCARAAEAARRRCWWPPLAWDDDRPGDPWYSGHGIDDPAAVPAPRWQRQLERARLTDGERVAELAELAAMGLVAGHRPPHVYTCRPCPARSGQGAGRSS
jgi:hypothetical protein